MKKILFLLGLAGVVWAEGSVTVYNAELHYCLTVSRIKDKIYEEV